MPVGTPSVAEYGEIFRRVCEANRIQVPPDLVPMLLREFYDRGEEHLASYHPKFLVDRVLDGCRYRGSLPALDAKLLAAAWRNLFVEQSGRSSKTLPS